MPEKNFIPHTNPDWNLELPNGDLNSLVDKNGTNHDDGYNFDEKDDEEELTFKPEISAEELRARNQARGKEALKDV